MPANPNPNPFLTLYLFVLTNVSMLSSVAHTYTRTHTRMHTTFPSTASAKGVPDYLSTYLHTQPYIQPASQPAPRERALHVSVPRSNYLGRLVPGLGWVGLGLGVSGTQPASQHCHLSARS
ncbi:hypothetical protein F4780DRAFT_118054 [Xylariomycetidae sp. FL0641]|nr:hypothetical protein F4780DRAFT_118054 [Xylariomycetidae sp. FL0641]